MTLAHERTTPITDRAESRAGAVGAAERRRLAARTRGAETAPLTILELSDFQCIDCRRFNAEIFPTIERRYVATGQLRWVFLNWPKSAKHRNARRAAEYALGAAEQDGFWRMHDRLFETFDEWADLDDPDGAFDASVDAAGLDGASIRAYLSSGRASAELDADARYIARWGVEYVPSFNLGGLVVTGGRSTDYMCGIIDMLLHQVAPRRRDP